MVRPRFLGGGSFWFEFVLERGDFDENGPKDFRRLTTKQSVGLKYGEIVVSVKDIVKENGDIKCINVTAELATSAEKVNLNLFGFLDKTHEHVRVLQHRSRKNLNKVSLPIIDQFENMIFVSFPVWPTEYLKNSK